MGSFETRHEPYLSIHAINVYVRDHDRSLRFYLDQLGFNLAFDARVASGERWVAVSPPDGTAVLRLIAAAPDSEQYKFVGRPSPVVFVTEDVPAKFREWRERGVRFRHTPRLKRVMFAQAATAGASRDQPTLAGEETPWGGVFTRFEDVDGNTFALVSFDVVSHAIDERRRQKAAKLESERRAAQEMEIARDVQARLFPQTLPPSTTLSYAGTCIQARQVGGDYYDFLNLGQDRLGLVIGDIAGKGIAAALLMANLQAYLRSQCGIALDQPQRFLRSVNQLFYDNTPDGAYTTLFFGEYDNNSRRLRYVNCGHLCGLLFRGSDSLERLGSTCTVLGLFGDWDCSVEECRLATGDTLALYTDGITESCNAEGEEFGEQRLVAALRRHRGLSAEAVVQSVVDEVRQFSPDEQQDDITVIVAQCTS